MTVFPRDLALSHYVDIVEVVGSNPIRPLRLVDQTTAQQWDSPRHFFSAAAESMRRILIERARKKQRLKHGGDRQRVDVEIHCPASQETPDRLVAIDEALARLQREHPETAELVKLRYFAGLPLKEAGPLLGISLATAKRRWAFARAFLYGELAESRTRDFFLKCLSHSPGKIALSS